MNNIKKPHYLNCLIYGKLIVITIMNCLYSHLFVIVFEVMGRQLSYMRFMKNFKEELETLLRFLLNPCSGNIFLIIAAISRVIKSSLIDKRKRLTTEESIALMGLNLNKAMN